MSTLGLALSTGLLFTEEMQLVESGLEEYAPNWLKEARKAQILFFTCYIPGALYLGHLLDYRFGIIRSGLSLGWAGIYSEEIMLTALCTTSFVAAYLIYEAASSIIMPKVYEYLDGSLNPESLISNDVMKGALDDYKDHPVSVDSKIEVPSKLILHKRSFCILRAALIALLSPKHRIFYCALLIAQLSYFIFKLRNLRASSHTKIELSFFWEGLPKKNWHPTVEKCDIEWDLTFSVTDQSKYLCPKGHLIAEDRQNLIKLIEAKRRALLDNSQVDISKTNWYDKSSYSHTTYESKLTLPKKDHMVCAKCEEPADSTNFECYGKDQRLPWHIDRNAPKIPYTAVAKSIISIDDPDRKKDPK